jgi:hypothetical protein
VELEVADEGDTVFFLTLKPGPTGANLKSRASMWQDYNFLNDEKLLLT